MTFKDVIIHNFVGLLLLFSTPVFLVIGARLGIEKLVEFGVGVGAAALFSFRSPKDSATTKDSK